MLLLLNANRNYQMNHLVPLSIANHSVVLITRNRIDVERAESEFTVCSCHDFWAPGKEHINWSYICENAVLLIVLI